MEYGSLLRDDLAFTQHEHRTDELGGSIAYRSAGHRSGGAGLRAATGTAWSFCCLCSIVSVWAGACLWSNCPSCLERSLSMSLLDAGLLICRVCMHRFVVVRREQEFAVRVSTRLSLSFCFHRGVGKRALKSNMDLGASPVRTFTKVDEHSYISRRPTKGCWEERVIMGDYFVRKYIVSASFFHLTNFDYCEENAILDNLDNLRPVSKECDRHTDGQAAGDRRCIVGKLSAHRDSKTS